MQAWKQQHAIQIGRNIRARRKELDLTQAALAEGLFSVQSVSLIERGKLKVTPETLTKLAERLRCTVDDLLLAHDLREDWLDELLATAERLQRERQVAGAIEAFHHLYSEALVKNHLHYLLQAAYSLCLLYNQSAKATISNEWGRTALHYLDPHQDLDRTLHLYITLGNNCYMLGHMWEAFDLLREAEKLIDPHLLPTEQTGRLFYSMAIIKFMLEHWEGCIWYSERALPIFEQLDNGTYAARTHLMLGHAFKEQERFDKGRHHTERALRMLAQTSDQTNLARCHHNLGDLEYELGEYAAARKNYQRSLKLKRQTQDVDALQNTLRMLSKVAIAEGKLDEARQFLAECITHAEKLQNPLQLAKTWQHLGELALVEERHEEYVAYTKRAIEVFEQLSFSTSLAEAAEKLGDYYAARGHVQLATPYLQVANRHYRKLLKKL